MQVNRLHDLVWFLFGQVRQMQGQLVDTQNEVQQLQRELPNTQNEFNF